MNFINNRRAMRSQSGFTLIELLVVIAILGILAGVVVFAIGGITDNGTKSACEIEKRTVRTAIGAYRAKNAAYPTTVAQLTGGQFLEDTPTNWVPDMPAAAGLTGTYSAECQAAGAA